MCKNYCTSDFYSQLSPATTESGYVQSVRKKETSHFPKESFATSSSKFPYGALMLQTAKDTSNNTSEQCNSLHLARILVEPSK
jgi:hypothetical protein